MPNDLPYFYWDACVPLSYINGIIDRLQHIDAFMSKSGVEFQLITSVLSITEVAFAACEKDEKALNPETEEKISNLWIAGSPIKVVEFYELIAVKAQLLMRAAITKGWSLRPADAIHLATADQLEAKAFHTYDDKLEKFSILTETKFPIVPPISEAPYLAFAAMADDDAQDIEGTQPESEPVPATGEDPLKPPESKSPASDKPTGDDKGSSELDVDAAGVEPASAESRGAAPAKPGINPPLSR